MHEQGKWYRHTMYGTVKFWHAHEPGVLLVSRFWDPTRKVPYFVPNWDPMLPEPNQEALEREWLAEGGSNELMLAEVKDIIERMAEQ